ncbi:MAG: hypothetical protein AB8G11_22150 [Saprospiraceae bacterium]
MRIIILLFGLFTFQADFHDRFYFEKIDVTDDGQYIAGISASDVVMIDATTQKIVTKYNIGGSRLLNIKISGNGKYLVWTQNWEMYHAEFVDEEIINVTKLNVAKSWLDLDINYDGSRIIATQDFSRPSKNSCQPGQRLILEMRRDGNPFSYRMVESTLTPCYWLSNCELLPDSSLLYVRHEANKFPQQYDLIEATADGKNWTYKVIKDSTAFTARQSVSANGDLLMYDCGFYILSKDKKGNWEKEDVLPPNDICIGNWNSAISPDGKTIVYIRDYRKDGYVQYSEFWITKKVDNEWTTPQLFLAPDAERFIQSIADFRLSNFNFMIANRNGYLYLKSTLEENLESDWIELKNDN